MLRRTKLSHEPYTKIFQSYHPDESEAPPSKRVCVDQRRIESVVHDIFTSQSRKLALSITDDKRAWIAANESLPYGHHRLQ